MVGSNGDAFDQLDQYWDDTVSGNARRSPDIEAGLASAVRQLHGLNDAVVPDAAFARRLWTDLSVGTANASNRGPLATPRAFPIVIPSRGEESASPHSDRQIPPAVGKTGGGGRNGKGRLRFPWSGWQRGFATVVTLTVVVMTLVAGYAAIQLRPPSHAGVSVVGEADDVELYSFMFNGTGESETDRWDIVPLDPMSLADRAPAAKQPAWASTLAEKWSTHLWALSADGSTYVAVETWSYVNGIRAKEATIGVYDAQTGAERTHIDLPTAVHDIRLSRDGSRLVIQAHSTASQVRAVGMHDPPAWYVVDSVDGRLITTVESDEQNGWHDDSWIDPEAHQLYRLFIPFSQENAGPGATRIVANDLTTGEEVGHIELPDVRSGVWWTDRTHTVPGGVEYPVIAELRPGVALSPDGKTLALVHADADAVTLVDAERLIVKRTESLTRPTGWRDRLLSLLPLVPGEAEAKGAVEGTTLQAVFAPDGRHLYVFGYVAEIDDDGKAHGRNLGLRLVDLDRTEIVADADVLSDDWSSELVPSANGRDLYLYGPRSEDVSTVQPRWRLWRLDASTLALRAEREFAGALQLHLFPSVPDGNGRMPPGAG